MELPFSPKQALKFDGALLAELQSGVSEQIAEEIISTLPPFPPNYNIHDNGCGYGVVTEKILEKNAPNGFRIKATDINPGFMAQLEMKVETNSWPVTTEIMDACNSTIQSETLDISIANFVINGLPDPSDALGHILRTLKPEGTAVFSVWNEMTWREALRATHYSIRGADAPLPPFIRPELTSEALRPILDKAGWENVKWEERTVWVETPDLHRWATLAWSFLGTPVGGWTQDDEYKWDEAIDSIVSGLKSAEGYHEKGGMHRLRMTAAIAFMSKD